MHRDFGSDPQREPPPAVVQARSGEPVGIQCERGVDGERVSIPQRGSPIPYLLAGGGFFVLLLVTVGLLAPDAKELIVMLLAVTTIGGIGMWSFVLPRLTRRPPQIVLLGMHGVDVDGERIAWDDLVGVRRTAGSRGSGLLLDGRGPVPLVVIGGSLRPSAAEYLHRRIEENRVRAQSGHEDLEAARAVAELRGREH